MFSFADYSVCSFVSGFALQSCLCCDEQASRTRSISHTPASCHSDLLLLCITALVSTHRIGNFLQRFLSAIESFGGFNILTSTWLAMCWSLTQWQVQGSWVRVGFICHGCSPSNFIPEGNAGYLLKEIVTWYLWPEELCFWIICYLSGLFFTQNINLIFALQKKRQKLRKSRS